MSTRGRRDQQGFTIIEVVMVVLILGILSLAAVSSFQGYLQEARRDDARDVLSLNVQRLKRCFTLEGVYNGSCVIRTESEAGLYKVTNRLATDSFTLTASPADGSSQKSDSDCQSFSVDHTGLRTAKGDDTDRCWP